MQTKETPEVKTSTDATAQTANRVTAEIVRTEDGEILTQYHARGRVYSSAEALREAQR